MDDWILPSAEGSGLGVPSESGSGFSIKVALTYLGGRPGPILLFPNK